LFSFENLIHRHRMSKSRFLCIIRSTYTFASRILTHLWFCTKKNHSSFSQQYNSSTLSLLYNIIFYFNIVVYMISTNNHIFSYYTRVYCIHKMCTRNTCSSTKYFYNIRLLWRIKSPVTYFILYVLCKPSESIIRWLLRFMPCILYHYNHHYYYCPPNNSQKVAIVNEIRLTYSKSFTNNVNDRYR